LAVLLAYFFSIASGEEIRQISQFEAYQTIAAREAAKEAQYQLDIARLGMADVLDSKVVATEEGILTVNAIRPPALVLKKFEPRKVDSSETKYTKAQWEALLAANYTKIPEQISMGANVYGDEYSEITWRDRETKSEFTVWTNISLNYLSPIHSIEDDAYEYLYFGFVTNYTREGEAKRLKMGKAHGYVDVESRWKSPPVKFSPDRFEYVVVEEAETEVPEKLYRQLDAMFGYYVANRENLEIQQRNSEVMRAARKKYLEANPPVPKRTMINFWKIDHEEPAKSE